MDIYSLAVTHLNIGPRPGPMSSRAEESHYSSRIVLPRLGPGSPASVIMTVSVILVLGMVLI